MPLPTGLEATNGGGGKSSCRRQDDSTRADTRTQHVSHLCLGVHVHGRDMYLSMAQKADGEHHLFTCNQ